MVNSWPAKQGSCSASESSPSREVTPIEGILEDLQSRIKRLERWHTINTVISKPSLALYPVDLFVGFTNLFLCNDGDRYYGHFWCLPWSVIRCTNGSVSELKDRAGYPRRSNLPFSWELTSCRASKKLTEFSVKCVDETKLYPDIHSASTVWWRCSEFFLWQVSNNLEFGENLASYAFKCWLSFLWPLGIRRCSGSSYSSMCCYAGACWSSWWTLGKLIHRPKVVSQNHWTLYT